MLRVHLRAVGPVRSLLIHQAPITVEVSMYQMKVTMFYVNKHYENSLKQLKTASTNSPWAYIWEGFIIGRIFVSEIEVGGGGLIFGRAYFCFCFFWGGGGGLLL